MELFILLLRTTFLISLVCWWSVAAKPLPKLTTTAASPAIATTATTTTEQHRVFDVRGLVANNTHKPSLLDKELFKTPPYHSGDRVAQRAVIKHNTRYLLTEMQHVKKFANGQEKVITRKDLDEEKLPKNWHEGYDFHAHDKKERDELQMAMMRVLLIRKKMAAMDKQRRFEAKEEAQKSAPRVISKLGAEYYRTPKETKVADLLTPEATTHQIMTMMAEQGKKQATRFENRRKREAQARAKGEAEKRKRLLARVAKHRANEAAYKKAHNITIPTQAPVAAAKKTLLTTNSTTAANKTAAAAAAAAKPVKLAPVSADCAAVCAHWPRKRLICGKYCAMANKQKKTVDCLTACKGKPKRRVCVSVCSAVVVQKVILTIKRQRAKKGAKANATLTSAQKEAVKKRRMILRQNRMRRIRAHFGGARRRGRYRFHLRGRKRYSRHRRWRRRRRRHRRRHRHRR